MLGNGEILREICQLKPLLVKFFLQKVDFLQKNVLISLNLRKISENDHVDEIDNEQINQKTG